MMNLRVLILTSTVLLPTTLGAAEKVATPEELVTRLQAAQRTGNPKAVLPYYGGPHRTLNEQAMAILEAATAFEKALDQKFGKDPTCHSMFALPNQPIQRVELKEKKDLGDGQIELTIWTVGASVVESRVVAIQENGGWVLLAPAPFTYTTSTEEVRTVNGQQVKVQVMATPTVPAEGLAAARVALPQILATLERGASDVAAGTYSSRQTAVTTVDKKITDVFEQAMTARKSQTKVK